MSAHDISGNIATHCFSNYLKVLKDLQLLLHHLRLTFLYIWFYLLFQACWNIQKTATRHGFCLPFLRAKLTEVAMFCFDVIPIKIWCMSITIKTYKYSHSKLSIEIRKYNIVLMFKFGQNPAYVVCFLNMSWTIGWAQCIHTA